VTGAAPTRAAGTVLCAVVAVAALLIGNTSVGPSDCWG
jgi:hypothetical protein